MRFRLPEGETLAVDGVSLTLDPGEVLRIVGESGSGKSQIHYALMGLLAANGRSQGQALLQGQDILSLSPVKMDRVRGRAMGMIFQDPMTSLNPYMRLTQGEDHFLTRDVSADGSRLILAQSVSANEHDHLVLLDRASRKLTRLTPIRDSH